MAQQEPARVEEPEGAAYLALDGADRKQVWILPAADDGPCERGELEQTPEALEVWASQRRTRFAGHPSALALEPSRGAVVFALTKDDHLPLYPVPPSMLAPFRQALVPARAKHDPGDTGRLLQLWRHHRHRLRRWPPDTEQTRELPFLVQARRQRVDDNPDLTNRVTAQ